MKSFIKLMIVSFILLGIIGCFAKKDEETKPQMTQSLPSMEGFDVLRDLYIWNTNQSGTLVVTSPVIGAIIAYNNKYTLADFSRANFSSGTSIMMDDNNLTSISLPLEINRQGLRSVYARNNELTTLDISGITTIHNIYLTNNNLTSEAVESILLTLDLSGVNGTNGETVDLSGSGNAPANANALIYAANLRVKGWTVNIN